MLLLINKVNGLLGLCSKAGKIAAGMDLVLEELSKKNVFLVIVAEDSSEKTKKNIKYYCEKANVEMLIFGNIETNSKVIGKHNKAIIGIRDKNLADAIKKVIHGGDKFGEN